MILWTIQHEGAWRRAQRRGVLRADGRRQWRHFRASYCWMQREMRQRIGEPPSGVQHAIWAWLQYENENKRRPDLRRSGHLPAGTPGVLLEFCAAEDNVLLSDFDLWHYVLNRWYLPQTPSEAKDELEDAARLRTRRLTRSWRRIFDLDFYLEGVSVPRSERSIQATVWQVPLGAIRSARVFRAR